jgi:hypothetical protein
MDECIMEWVTQVFYAKEVLADLYKDLKGLRFVLSYTQQRIISLPYLSE